MSDDDPTNQTSDSGSGSDSEDIETTGLIATRAKRSNAGNVYSRLRAHLDDEEFQRELLGDEPEDENDFGDYEGGDGEADDDAAFDSSSDEEDAGPPKEGEAEDLSGEKEVKKAERAEARKKRKAKDVRMVVPAWQKKKKVKLADDVKTEDGGSDRPKKKSERSNWLPAPADMPTRQSDRSLARANREVTHAHLKQSAERSEKQRKVMKNAAEREKANKREDLTQEQRLAMALKIETQTKKEFGRWEREEKERQRIRDEQLAAKRRRIIYGPIMRYWSGSAIWQGDVLKEKRVLPDSYQEPEEIEMIDEPATKDAEPLKAENSKPPTGPADANALLGEPIKTDPAPEGDISKHNEESNAAKPNVEEDATKPDKEVEATKSNEEGEASKPNEGDEAAGSKVKGEASNPNDTTVKSADDVRPKEDVEMQEVEDTVQPSTAASTSETRVTTPNPPANPADKEASSNTKATADLETSAVTPSERIDAATKPDLQSTAKPETTLLQGIHDYAAVPPSERNSMKSAAPFLPPSVVFYVPSSPILHTPVHVAPSPPRLPTPPPLPRERAQRCLVMLDQFENLDTAMAPKKLPKNMSILEPRELATVLIPESYPTFTPDEAKYLTAKMKKRGIDPPPKLRCALTSWPAKFRDPKTGLAYADLQTYKIIQRVLAGGCAWSSVLGAWVGPAYGSMGRPAKGVPPGFAGPVVEATPRPVVKSESEQQ